ncbi:MAG: hypothetical protein ACQESD_03965 [Thermoplasmatota archaeon]
MKKIHVLTASISVLFGIISVMILVTLKVEGVIVVIPLWLLGPFFLKKLYDKIGDFLLNNQNA